MNVIKTKQRQATANSSLKKARPFIAPLLVQKKLSIGSANDMYEQEADAIADRVIAMPERKMQKQDQSGPLLQRKCAACEEDEPLQMKPLSAGIKPMVQRSSSASRDERLASDTVTKQIVQSKGSGRSMDNRTQHYMESRFGADFSGVKIHTNNNAIQLSRQLNAQAFTVGSDIYFNEGKYNPDSTVGKHLLAHELTHTVQQDPKKIRRSIVSPSFDAARHKDEKQDRKSTQGHIQLMRQRNQSGGRDHMSGGVAPWEEQGHLIPSGDDHKAYTDNGSNVNAWTAIEYTSDAQRYWCHGHTLGTYSRWFYSVYSGGSLRRVIAQEYNSISERSVRNGDIAVWTPSYGHSCKIETAVHTSSGGLDTNATQVSTKNGLNPLRTTSLSNTQGVYASLTGAVSFFRKK